jgi:hypothetical protein
MCNAQRNGLYRHGSVYWFALIKTGLCAWKSEGHGMLQVSSGPTIL